MQEERDTDLEIDIIKLLSVITCMMYTHLCSCCSLFGSNFINDRVFHNDRV